MSSATTTAAPVAITTANFETTLNGELEKITTPLWMLFCGTVVMYMQAGFAMLTAGCGRDKNVQSILMKNMIDIWVGALGWFSVGWSFAYVGATDRIIGGKGEYFLSNVAMDGTSNNYYKQPGGTFISWFFQWAFCATAATIVSGSLMERVNLWAYLIYVIVMTTLIYPCVVATSWGGGMFNETDDAGARVWKFEDFAGSGVVHLTGGVGALVGAIVLGPRLNRWTSQNSSEFDPHSMTLVTLGTLILWMGFYGFNCGSTLGMASAANATSAGLVAVNTTIAAASCACLVFVISSLPQNHVAHGEKQVRIDLGGVCNGVLSGLVSITAGCGTVKPWEAMIIGFIGAFVYIGSDLLLKKLKIDDPLNAFPVHGACGMWGVIAAGLFSGINDDGEDKWKPIGTNLLMIVFIWAWCGGISFIVFYGLHKVDMLRA